MVEIKSYPARNGDAFLVKASDGPFAMLIDGGYAETFQNSIRPDLEDLAANGMMLDLVVATHIDADHISGLLSFFKLNGPSHAPEIIQVNEVLHNSLCSLVQKPVEQAEVRSDDLALLGEIRSRGYPLPSAVENRAREISARQGSSLAQLLRDGGYRWNTRTGDIPVGEGGHASFSFPQASITVLGPTKERLDALRGWWISEIRRLGMVGPTEGLDDVFEYLSAYEMASPIEEELLASSEELASAHRPDISITNGSSISLIVEIDEHRLLFLGDAWPADTVRALERTGDSFFDAIKVSHHGSARNTCPNLLGLVDSPNYFISTNGDGHSHPDFAVLKAIVDRPSAFRRILHFNYSTPASRRLREYQSKHSSDFLVREDETGTVAVSRQRRTS